MVGQCKSRSGHTFIELMIALPLMVAVIAAAGGIIAVAHSSRSLADGMLANQVKSLTTSQRVLSDVQFANSIAEASSNALEFSVSDRNGDLNSDVHPIQLVRCRRRSFNVFLQRFHAGNRRAKCPSVFCVV